MPGIKHNMETVDEDILDYTQKFIDKAKKDGAHVVLDGLSQRLERLLLVDNIIGGEPPSPLARSGVRYRI
jgi:hypothetical protein